MEILLVEDNQGDVDLIREGLEESGINFNLNVVMNGSDAIRYLERDAPFSGASRPNLVLLDLRIPNVGGKDVLKAIKGNRSLKKVPVVIFSSSQDPHEVSSCYELCANSFVAKPMNFEEYIEKIKSVAKYWCDVPVWPA